MELIFLYTTPYKLPSLLYWFHSYFCNMCVYFGSSYKIRILIRCINVLFLKGSVKTKISTLKLF